MSRAQPSTPRSRGRWSREPHGFRELLHRLLFHANRGLARVEFLRQASGVLRDFAACDAVEVRLDERARLLNCKAGASEDGSPSFDCRVTALSSGHSHQPSEPDHRERIMQAVLSGEFAAAAPFVTRGGSFWTGDTAGPVLVRERNAATSSARSVVLGGPWSSLAVIPIPVDEQTRGVLLLGSVRRDFFDKDDIQFFEAVAETLGVTLAHQGAQWSLRLRAKELACLHGIAQIAQSRDLDPEKFLADSVQLLPLAWQYPEIACARIVLDGRSFETPDFVDGPWKQSGRVRVEGEPRGSVEVVYREQRPEEHEGPFSEEERELLHAVAETVGSTLGRLAARRALADRARELACLHEVVVLSGDPGLSNEDLLARTVRVLPEVWAEHVVRSARLSLDGRVYETDDYREGEHWESAPLLVDGVTRGELHVVFNGPVGSSSLLGLKNNRLERVAETLGSVLARRGTPLALRERVRGLAAGAAEELNEPLSNILGFTQLARKHGSLPPEVSRDLDRIESAALRARETIKKLLHFARVVPVQRAPLDLNGMVQDGLCFVESLCNQEGIRLVRELGANLPRIGADVQQLREVLANLVVNAIQSMPGGGTLTIRTYTEADEVVLEVADTGAGMTRDVVKQVFDPFYTTKDVARSSGLGLSVAYGIVTSHGGTIQVDSEPDQGSCFRVRLPATRG